jgi:hypothetical protein
MRKGRVVVNGAGGDDNLRPFRNIFFETCHGIRVKN